MDRRWRLNRSVISARLCRESFLYVMVANCTYPRLVSQHSQIGVTTLNITFELFSNLGNATPWNGIDGLKHFPKEVIIVSKIGRVTMWM